MGNTTYNGWKNYETWAVALWLDNDYGTYEYVRELAEDATRVELADRIEEYVKEAAPELEASMFADLLNAAIGEVDFLAIADNLLSE